MNAAIRNAFLVCTSVLALSSLGCSSPPTQGRCGSSTWKVKGTQVRINAEGVQLRGDLWELKSQVESGKEVTFSDTKGNHYAFDPSDYARQQALKANPCPMIDEWLAYNNNLTKPQLPMGNNGGSTGGTSGGGGSGAASGEGTDVNSGFPADANQGSSGASASSVTLYSGSYGSQSDSPWSTATDVTFARPPGSSASRPALFVFETFALKDCTVSLPSGQTVIYVKGNVSLENVDFLLPGQPRPGTAPGGLTPQVVLAPTSDARDLLILGTGTCKSASIIDCALSAGIYLPAAAVTVTGTQLNGGVVGASVTCSNSQVTYDPHLKVLNFEGLGIASARWTQEQ